MPSSTAKQAKTMSAIAHGWHPTGSAAHIPVNIAKEFHAADTGHKYGEGNVMHKSHHKGSHHHQAHSAVPKPQHHSGHGHHGGHEPDHSHHHRAAAKHEGHTPHHKTSHTRHMGAAAHHQVHHDGQMGIHEKALGHRHHAASPGFEHHSPHHEGNAPTHHDVMKHLASSREPYNPVEHGYGFGRQHHHDTGHGLNISGSHHSNGGEAKHWISGAIKHPGSFSKAAKSHHMSTHAFAEKEKHAGGKMGKKANLALTLEHMHHRGHIDHRHDDKLQNIAGDRFAGEGMSKLRSSDNPRSDARQAKPRSAGEGPMLRPAVGSKDGRPYRDERISSSWEGRARLGEAYDRSHAYAHEHGLGHPADHSHHHDIAGGEHQHHHHGSGKAEHHPVVAHQHHHKFGHHHVKGSHGFGHGVHQHHGHHRLSGHEGAHRIGVR